MVVNNLIYLQALRQIDKVGNKKCIEISNFLKFDTNIIKTDEEFIFLASKFFDKEAIKRKLDQSYTIHEKHLSENIQSISYYDKNYPKNFLNLSSVPAIIYIKGNYNSNLVQKKMAVIGTRNPSHESQITEKLLVEILVNRNILIVSGLALGCDTIAHKVAIEKNGITIPVLPSSLMKNEVYPGSNINLFEKSLINGFAVSEYPAGSKIQAFQFIQRDRLQSAISDGVFVIETGIKGGTMNTYNFATKQKVPIACISPEKENEVNSGNYKILENNETYQISNEKDLLFFIEKII